MKLDFFDIQFESSSGRYLAGSVVCGSIIISVSQPVKVQAITVRLHGETRTSWVNKTSDKIYETELEILDLAENLSGYLTHISDGELLPEGVHTMTFKFQLPPNLPSSIYNEYFGWVRYICIASVEVARDSCLAMITGTNELKVDKPVIIYSLVNKDILPNAREPYQAADSIELIGCFGSQGLVAASLNLVETGFLAGENLPVDVRLSNKSKKKIKRCPVLALCQQTFFRARNRYESELFDQKELTQVIDTVSIAPPQQGEETVRSVQIGIPHDLPPSSLSQEQGGTDSSEIVMISYFLKLDMDSFDLTAPVVICSIGSSSSRVSAGRNM